MLLLLFAQPTFVETTWAKGENSSQWDASATQLHAWEAAGKTDHTNWQPDSAPPPTFTPSTDSLFTWL